MKAKKSETDGSRAPYGFWIKAAAWIPALFLAAVIFGFSAQNGVQSGGLSHRIAKLAVEAAGQVFPISEGKTEFVTAQAEHLIRKAAHMTEYALLALLVSFALAIDGVCFNRRLWYVLPAVFLFACTDEFHQLYVPGRCGTFTDVLIDTAGGGLAMFACAVVRRIRLRQKNT